ncbi:MAG: hypothetical protein HN505_03885 [Verrucomicrobia bacterium]|jgi:methyl-accepting chemotaxis protein/predicted RNA-binding Zn-ribbon protein involved in translation (DUF1610 family)|nr:hypothetical protein [Verrucomicrobiota bacterium]
MNPHQKIHCPSCGYGIEFPPEKEGTTDACPNCGKPVWLSHLAERNDASGLTVKSDRSHVQSLKPGSGGSNSLVIAMLGLLILFNVFLGFQVIQLKGQIHSRSQQSGKMESEVLPARSNKSSDLVQRATELSSGNEAVSNQEMVSVLLEAMELLDEDIHAEMARVRADVSNHSNSINELMEASSQLNASIETIYEDLSNVSTSLEQLSTSLSDVQENQLILQNVLSQGR